MPMAVLVVVVMTMPMLVVMVCVVVPMAVIVIIFPVFQQHMHLHALDAAPFLGQAFKGKLILKAKLGQLIPEVVGADSKINHGRQIHVAADSGKAVVVKNFHKTPVIGAHLLHTFVMASADAPRCFCEAI